MHSVVLYATVLFVAAAVAIVAKSDTSRLCYGVSLNTINICGGAKPTRRSNQLGFRAMMRAFWLSLIDPGNEEALLQSKPGRSSTKNESKKSSSGGWLSGMGKRSIKSRR